MSEQFLRQCREHKAEANKWRRLHDQKCQELADARHALAGLDPKGVTLLLELAEKVAEDFSGIGSRAMESRFFRNHKLAHAALKALTPKEEMRNE